MSCCAPCSPMEVLDQSALAKIQEEWDDLLRRSYDNRIFLTPAWFRIWIQHFNPADVRILTSRSESGGLEAVLPLQTQIQEGSRVLSLLGDPDVADYMDGAAEKPRAEGLLAELWHAAWHEVAWDRIELRHVPSTSPLLPALQHVAAHRGAELSVAYDEVCPVALLCSTWDAYLHMLSKKQRHEIRRKLRRAQDDAEWEWRTARTATEVDRDLEVYFRLHELSAHHKANFLTPAMRDFFRALAHELLDRGFLRLSVFRRDGVDVAATLGILHRERYLLYNSGYDQAHAAHSPGIAAVAHAMMDAIEEKAVAFDFLSGDEPYKYQFGASNTHTCRVLVCR